MTNEQDTKDRIHRAACAFANGVMSNPDMTGHKYNAMIGLNYREFDSTESVAAAAAAFAYELEVEIEKRAGIESEKVYRNKKDRERIEEERVKSEKKRESDLRVHRCRLKVDAEYKAWFEEDYERRYGRKPDNWTQPAFTCDPEDVVVPQKKTAAPP